MYVHIKTYVCIAACHRSQTVAPIPVFTNDEWVTKCDVFIQWYITQPKRNQFHGELYLNKKKLLQQNFTDFSGKEIEMTGAHRISFT